MTNRNRVLFVKPPDRFLENEFVYPQLGPHYLQSFLARHEIGSDILILYKRWDDNSRAESYDCREFNLAELSALLLKQDGTFIDGTFDLSIFDSYEIVGMSVMTPQAPDAYLLNKLIKKTKGRIGQDLVYKLGSIKTRRALGWKPIYSIKKGLNEIITYHNKNFINIPKKLLTYDDKHLKK